MDIGEYLGRIGYFGAREPGVDTLRGIHRAHMRHVPFENLDIHLGREIVLELPRLFDKVVRARRGGFCHELNGLLSWALAELGFRVTLQSASVFDDGAPGTDFEHMTIRVDLEEPWLADVGFGDSFVEPLRFAETGGVSQGGVDYRIVDRVVSRRADENAGWEPQYEFRRQPRELGQFARMCHFQQTSPESHFTQKVVCSLATETGRKTLTADRLITTAHGDRDERAIADETQWARILVEEFGIDLGTDPPRSIYRSVR